MKVSLLVSLLLAALCLVSVDGLEILGWDVFCDSLLALVVGGLLCNNEDKAMTDKQEKIKDEPKEEKPKEEEPMEEKPKEEEPTNEEPKAPTEAPKAPTEAPKAPTEAPKEEKPKEEEAEIPSAEEISQFISWIKTTHSASGAVEALSDGPSSVPFATPVASLVGVPMPMAAPTETPVAAPVENEKTKGVRGEQPKTDMEVEPSPREEKKDKEGKEGKERRVRRI